MRKIKLLLAAMAALVGLSAQATTEWTGVSELTNGSYYYIVNTETGLYLGAGQGYSTRATVNRAPTGRIQANELSAGHWQLKFEYRGNGLVQTGNSDYESIYTDRNDQANYQWNVVNVGGTDFTIQLASDMGGYNASYFLAPQSNGISIVVNNSTNADLSKWRFVTEEEINNAIANAVEGTYVDVSTKMYNVQQSWTGGYSTQQWNSNGNLTAGFREQWVASGALSDGELSYTMSDMPAGHYRFSADVIATQQSDGDNDTYGGIWVFINDNKVECMTKNGISKSYSVETDLVATGSIKVGHRIVSTTCNWTGFGNVKLEYYPVDPLKAYKALLSTAKENAAAVEESTTTNAAYNAVQTAVSTYGTPEETLEAYEAAVEAINDAVAKANALKTPYAYYGEIRTNVLALKSDLDVTAANTAVEEAMTADAINAALLTLRNAYTTYLTGAAFEDVSINLAAALIDNPAPYANSNYWTVTNASGEAAVANAFDNGNRCAEFWNQKGYSIKQTLNTTLPAGYYTLTGIAVTREGMEGLLIAGDKTTKIATMARRPDPYNGADDGVLWLNSRAGAKTYFDAGNGVNTLTFQLTEATADLLIGLTADSKTSDYWTVWRSFELTYLGTAPISVLSTQLDEAIAAAKETASTLAVPAGVAGLLTGVANDYEAAKASYSTAKQFVDAMDAIADAVEAAETAIAPTAENPTILGKATATAALEALGTDAKTTLQGVIDNNETTLAACTTAAQVETQNTALWNAIGAAINSIELTGDETLNLTYLLTNPDVSSFPAWTKRENVPGWYTEQADGNSQTMTNDAATSEDGTKTHFFEYWSNPAKANDAFALYQKVTLPVGTYIINCYAFAQDQYAGANSIGVYFYANETQGSPVTTSRLTEANCKFINNATQEVKVGLKTIEGNTYNWMGIGYMTLSKVADKVITLNENADYTPADDAGKVELTRTIKEGYNSVVLPFELTAARIETIFGAGSKVYTYSEAVDLSGDSEVTFTEAASVSANTPVLVKATVANDGNSAIELEDVKIAVGSPVVTGTNFDFQGLYAAAKPEVGDFFLSGNTLFKATAETLAIKPFRAYFKNKNTGASVKFYIEGIETAISTLKANKAQTGVIYNLAGQRMQKAQKGINIVNGKKVVIR